MRLGYAIFAVATLTFIGFGVQPPSPDWAAQINQYWTLIDPYWWMTLFPALAIASLSSPSTSSPTASARCTSDERSRRRGSTPSRSRISSWSTGARDRPARPPRGLVLDRARPLVRARRRVRLRQVDRGARHRPLPAAATAASRAAASRSPGGRPRAQRLATFASYHARTVSMVYQNPGSALNPACGRRAGRRGLHRARRARRRRRMERAREALAQVQIADPASVLGRYPHQLSGGMQQRVVIAMALAKDPALLILDEPTTGLDATVEAEVLDLVANLQAELDTAVLFISHNLGVISKMCDRVGVLYAGRLVEEGPVETVLQDPRHPYTVGLLRCIPRGGVRKDKGRLDTIPGFLPSLGADDPGLRLRRPLRARRRSLPHRGAGADRARRRATRARCFHHDAGPAISRARRRPSSRCPPSTARATPLLRFDDLGKVFQQHGHGHPCARRRQRRDLAGRDPRARRRVGKRQDDARPHAARDRRPDHRAPSSSRARALAPRYQKRTREDLRSIQIVFQNPDSALNRRHSVQRILLRVDEEARRRSAGTAADARLRELAGARPDHRAHADAEAGAALGRPQAARRDRPRVRGRPEARRLRRADLGARRLGAGRHPQPARRAAGRAAASPTSSSPTTSASCATSPTGSRCSTSAA